MVGHPSVYRWSGYHHNVTGRCDYPISPHAQWLALGSVADERRLRYKTLVEEEIGQELLRRIR